MFVLHKYFMHHICLFRHQFAFPFVETFRCKEINFHIRLKETWKHTDYDFSEIDYEMARRERDQPHKLERVQSVDLIEDLLMEDSDSDEEGSTRPGGPEKSASTSSSNQVGPDVCIGRCTTATRVIMR